MTSSVTNKLSVVIASYQARGIDLGQKLVQSLADHSDELVWVINSDEATAVTVRQDSPNVIAITRPNTGMNIGAWSEGLTHCDADAHVLCLQDECELNRLDFATRYKQLLSHDGVGMVGESLNPKWARSWQDIYASPLNYQVKISPSQQTTRVQYYLACMKSWGIQPGSSGSHLRALIWGFSAQARKSLSHLPIGLNKEQCIAAEIGTCKFIENNLGLKIIQSDDLPFQFFSHTEWDVSGMGKRR